MKEWVRTFKSGKICPFIAKLNMGNKVTFTHQIERLITGERWYRKTYGPVPCTPFKRGMIVGKRTVYLKIIVDGGNYDEPLYVSLKENKVDVFLVCTSPFTNPIRVLPEHILTEVRL